MVQVVGKIPEFTEDASVEEKEVEVTAPAEEKDTPAPSADKPSDPEKAADDTAPSQDSEELAQTLSSLQKERTELLKEIAQLRGNKRELKNEKLQEFNQRVDDLKDIHPDDAELIDRVIRAKGFVTQDQATQMFYKAVEQEELDKFLAKYPEYKPENDPNNINWSLLEQQIEKEKDMGYARPKNPHLIGTFLERVHQSVSGRIRRDVSITAKKRQLEVAGVGTGGTQPSSSPKRLSSDLRAYYERGGWSEDEIRKIEARLPE